MNNATNSGHAGSTNGQSAGAASGGLAEAARGRQRRLLRVMEDRSMPLAVLSRPASVQWLTGAYFGPLFATSAAIDSNGLVTLVCPSRGQQVESSADIRLVYEEKWLSTMRDASDQQQACTAALLEHLGDLPRGAGYEVTTGGALLAQAPGRGLQDLDAEIFRLRRQKDTFELSLMRKANAANRRMYEWARTSIHPGVNELEVYAGLHREAVETLGEPLTYFGQDFRAAARGGPPRDRRVQAGELYILDLGVGLRGYHTDNARTLSVGAPTAAQQDAWGVLAEVFPLIESTVAPGVSCREVYQEVSARLAAADPWRFNHHLGHGVGLAPHEGPHLNPNWDDRFAVGDYFTVEPGLYHDDLKQGLRLEQNYVVTEAGVELQTDWPLGL